MAEQNGNPVVLARGRFALFQTPNGGLHLSILYDGDEQEKHMELPPAMLKMMRMAVPGMGDPIKILRNMGNE